MGRGGFDKHKAKASLAWRKKHGQVPSNRQQRKEGAGGEGGLEEGPVEEFDGSANQADSPQKHHLETGFIDTEMQDFMAQMQEFEVEMDAPSTRLGFGAGAAFEFSGEREASTSPSSSSALFTVIDFSILAMSFYKLPFLVRTGLVGGEHDLLDLLAHHTDTPHINKDTLNTSHSASSSSASAASPPSHILFTRSDALETECPPAFFNTSIPSPQSPVQTDIPPSSTSKSNNNEAVPFAVVAVKDQQHLLFNPTSTAISSITPFSSSSSSSTKTTSASSSNIDSSKHSDDLDSLLLKGAAIQKKSPDAVSSSECISVSPSLKCNNIFTFTKDPTAEKLEDWLDGILG